MKFVGDTYCQTILSPAEETLRMRNAKIETITISKTN